uniref:Uncharacterized protein n=1 Tax=Arundo donax TaxID=35708 RepID=A0A0A9FZ22_ARUDO
MLSKPMSRRSAESRNGLSQSVAIHTYPPDVMPRLYAIENTASPASAFACSMKTRDSIIAALTSTAAISLLFAPGLIAPLYKIFNLLLASSSPKEDMPFLP